MVLLLRTCRWGRRVLCVLSNNTQAHITERHFIFRYSIEYISHLIQELDNGSDYSAFEGSDYQDQSCGDEILLVLLGWRVKEYPLVAQILIVMHQKV